MGKKCGVERALFSCIWALELFTQLTFGFSHSVLARDNKMPAVTVTSLKSGPG